MGWGLTRDTLLSRKTARHSPFFPKGPVQVEGRPLSALVCLLGPPELISLDT